MSVFDKAKAAAREAAGQAGRTAADLASLAAERASDPQTQRKAREALEAAGRGAKDAAAMARKGVTTVIERIEPATLADVIIRATAVQEKTNESLRQKGSLYRISEVQISASIPPGINFAISRIEEPAGAGQGLASVDLVGADAAEPVLALDGEVDSSDV
jgi:hypothetical protein